MNLAIESTRFGEHCINIYRVGGHCYLVCGKRGRTECCFTQTVFPHCHQQEDNLIRTLQRQLQALEKTNDFQEWFRLVQGMPWDTSSDNSRCPICFLGCRQVADELRKLMRAEYGQFLTTTLQIKVDELASEPGGYPASRAVKSIISPSAFELEAVSCHSAG